MSVPTRRILNPIFGQPVLRCGGVSKVGWVKDTGNVEALYQKSTSGYLANLYGGVMSGDDWAAVFIPVNEMPITDFASALWTYRLDGVEAYGVNIVVWVHDPNDNDKRAEITQLGSVSGLEKAAEWNAHELNFATTQFFFYGEGTTGTGLTAGTQYTFVQFQADAIFKNWTIYRISIEYGWIASGTLDDAWVADIKLNNQVIPLIPPLGEPLGRETKSVYWPTATNSSTVVTLVTPGATKRIRVKVVYMSAGSTAANYEMYFATGTDITSDKSKAIALATLDTDKIGSVAIPFGDEGPLGEIGEAVSVRTSADVTTEGAFILIYKEE